MAIAAITGLAAEARLLRRIGIAAVATGGQPARIANTAGSLPANSSLLSFGIAGGLARGLAPGTIVLPLRVQAASGAAYPVDMDWRGRVAASLAARGMVALDGDLFGAPRPIATATEKEALNRRTGAIAVDLESHVLARAAQRHGRPFLALRAVADGAELDLPPAAAIGLDTDGRAAPGRVLMALLREPQQLAALLRVARVTRLALAALAKAVEALREID